MLIKERKLCYNDVMIVPAKVSNIEHRKECDPFYRDGYLPIFTAPMSTVVNENNYQIFEDNKSISSPSNLKNTLTIYISSCSNTYGIEILLSCASTKYSLTSYEPSEW